MRKREKMIKDDKARIIGKIISIKSDRFSVELLSGIRNFNVNGFDDIHYFAQLNSYVAIPCQNYYIVAEVAGVYEQDNLNKTNIKEQELNKIYSNKFLEVLPIGVLKTKSKEEIDFEFGVSIYPTLYSDVLYIKDNELDAVFRVNEIETKDEKTNNTIPHALEIGKSAIFSDYNIKINIDKFFGAHSAILGNTGSGKSCTITSMIQTKESSKARKQMEKMLYMKSMAMIQLLLHSMMNYIHLTELAVLLLYSNRQLLMQTLTQQVK